MYLYKTTIYHDTSNSVGIPATNAVSVADFEDNNKVNSVLVDSVTISETTFILERSYESFDELIVDGIYWSDVKYVDDGTRYIMYLLANNALD